MADADPLIGRTLGGRYTVKRLIGKGGMGRVYEGDHLGLDKRVAIKVLANLGDADAIARFRREAKTAGKVSHEHVVEVFDVATDADGTDFLVMEYFDGLDLRQAVANQKLEPERVIAIGAQILEGLEAIHAAGLVHRDIKPANILIATNADGEDLVKLTDFGIAKSVRDREAAITEVGKVVGTYEYMAPEALTGDAVDHRADIYAVGLTLYAMLAGNLPFDTQTTNTIIATHLAGTLPPLSVRRPDLPASLVAAITRALSMKPSDRFADAAAFAAALEGRAPVDRVSAATVSAKSRPRVLADASAPTTTHGEATKREVPPTVSRGRRIGMRIAVGAFLLIALTPIVVYLMPDRHPRVIATTPAPRDAAVAATPDAVTAIGLARAAEEANDLELAIAQYQVAYAETKDPKALYHAAELEERLGHPPEAAQLFRRYLDAAPKATDREVVAARIARLLATESALPAPAIDSAVRPRGTSSAPIASGGQTRCACFRTKASRHAGLGGLCKTLQTPRCRCGRGGFYLCPQPFVLDHGGEICQPDDYRRTEYTLPGNDGDPCEGYADRSGPKVKGALECNSCVGERYEFRGKNGDPCEGYDAETREKLPGRLENCDDPN